MGKSDLTALHNYVLVEEQDFDETSAAGIVIVQGNNPVMSCGVVISVGKGQLQGDGKPQPLCVKVGDKVAYASDRGWKFTRAGKKHRILEEREVVLKLQEK